MEEYVAWQPLILRRQTDAQSSRVLEFAFFGLSSYIQFTGLFSLIFTVLGSLNVVIIDMGGYL